MALRVEWIVEFQPFDPKSVRFGYQFKEGEFRYAYTPVDTPSPQARNKMNGFDSFLYTRNETLARIMNDRNALASVLAEHFRETIMQVLAQHDTIDGYPKYDKPSVPVN